MKAKNMNMFYLSALVAIAGAVGYQYFVKQVPETINPIVSVIGMYVVVLVISIFLLPLFPSGGGLPGPFQTAQLDSSRLSGCRSDDRVGFSFDVPLWLEPQYRQRGYRRVCQYHPGCDRDNRL